MMELVYKNGLVQFSGSEERERHGERLMVFHFRNGAGEAFQVEMPQAQVPDNAFACHNDGFEQALQAVLDWQEHCLSN